MKYAIAAVFLLFLGSTARAEQWTILTQVCWRLAQPTYDQRGQCAIGLQGTFRDRGECMRSNRGLLQTNTQGPQGEFVGRRCELLLQR